MGGGEFLKFVTCLRVLFFANGGCRESKKVGHFLLTL